MKHIIRRLCLYSFKAFEKTCFDLKPLTVFIGKTGSGKSSIIDSLAVLREITTRGCVHSCGFERWWSLRNLVHNRDPRGFRVSITAVVGDVSGRYTVHIDPRSGRLREEYVIENTVYSVEDGVVRASDARRMRGYAAEAATKPSPWDMLDYDSIRVSILPWLTMVDFSRAEISYWGDGKSAIEVVPDLFSRTVSRRAELKKPSEKEMWALQILFYNFSKYAIAIHDLLRRSIVVGVPKLYRGLGPTRNRATILDYDLSNLPYVLRLHRGRGILEYVSEKISEILGREATVEVRETVDRRSYIVLNIGNTVLDPPSMPRSMVKIIAVLAAAYMKTDLIAIDDFDEYLDMETAHALLDVLRESDAQVIITSRRPGLAAELQPENVILL